MASTEAAKRLSQSLHLPCGRVVPNRLVKAPLEELLASRGGGLPNEKLFQLYRHWARGGWGMVITGNVAIDDTHLGTPFDVVIPFDEQKRTAFAPEVEASFRRYASAVKGQDQSPPVQDGPLAVVQLVHAGRQSMRGGGRAPWKAPLAPSSVPMTTSASIAGKVIDTLMWNTPQAMTRIQIRTLIDRFATAAELCYKAGFDGVEVHGSHGYQVAAFLSPRTNLRTDEYGGSRENRARLLLEIIDAIRQRVPKTFIVGVKLNSCDYVQGGLMEDDALVNVGMLAERKDVDYVQISGGNYENPGKLFESDAERFSETLLLTPSRDKAFMTENFNSEEQMARLDGLGKEHKPKRSQRTAAREAFFQAFAQRARSYVEKSKSDMALILVGGLRTRKGMADPIAKGYVDAVAMGRLACVYPEAPRILLNEDVADDDPSSSPAPYKVGGSGTVALLPLTLLNAGWTTLWHGAMLGYLSRNELPDVKANPAQVVSSVFFPSLVHLARRMALIFAVLALGLSAVFSFFVRHV